MLWTRALTQDPAARYSFRPDEETLEWHGHGDRELEGTITVDGSCIGGAAELGATGWAAVQAADDDEGSATGTSARRGEYIAISGTVPNALPVQRKSGRAELWAVYQALLHAVAPGR